MTECVCCCCAVTVFNVLVMFLRLFLLVIGVDVAVLVVVVDLVGLVLYDLVPRAFMCSGMAWAWPDEADRTEVVKDHATSYIWICSYTSCVMTLVTVLCALF